MLANATRYVAKRANSTILISRNPIKLAKELNAKPLTLDWRDKDKAKKAVSLLPKIHLLISWLHNDGVWLLEYLEKKLVNNGRSIRVYGSGYFDKKIESKNNNIFNKNVRRQNVVLGCIIKANAKRWLTNNEISEAVIKAVNNQDDEIIIAGVNPNS